MPRLFTSKKDLAFFSDITKELIKDVIGQKILYYPISALKTKAHELYNESPEKIFDNPIELEVMADSPKNETSFNRFGYEETFSLELYIQWRDLVDKGATVEVGDFFQYGENFYEVHQVNHIKAMHGMVEHKDGIRVFAKKARDTQFRERLLGPTDISYDNGTQDTFVQQRGLPENRLGQTGDKRDLQENGLLDPPPTGAKEVSERGDTGTGSSFYGDD